MAGIEHLRPRSEGLGLCYSSGEDGEFSGMVYFTKA